MALSFVWYALAGRRYYTGPRSNLPEEDRREVKAN
jgi:hypothetical protein